MKAHVQTIDVPVGLFAYAATDLYLQHPWWLQ